MTAHDELERQLRASVARTAPAGGRPPHRRPRRRLPDLPQLAGGLVVAVSLAIAVLVVVAVRHGSTPNPRVTATPTITRAAMPAPKPPDPGPIPQSVDDAAVANGWNTAWAKDPICSPAPHHGSSVVGTLASPSASMLATVPALSTPESSAESLRIARLLGTLPGQVFQSGAVYVNHVRRARAAAGQIFYLVPVSGLGRRPLTPAQANRCHALTVAALATELPKVPAAQRAATRRYGDAEYALGRYNLEHSSVHEGIFLLSEGEGELTGRHGIDGGQSPATIRSTGMLGGGGGGKPFTPIVMDGIVPAGVASVTLEFPVTRYRGRTLPALSVTGRVVNDVYVIGVPSLFERGGWPAAVVWHSASGAALKTVNEKPFHP